MLVQDMYDGVKAMIKKEKELRPKEEEKEVFNIDRKIEAGPHLKRI